MKLQQIAFHFFLLASLLPTAPASWADSHALSFARAMELRRTAQEWNDRKQAELQIGQALEGAELGLSAYRAYYALLEDAEAPAEIRLQALKQINAIERRFPSLTQVKSPEILPTDALDDPSREWIFRQFQLALSQGTELSSAERWAKLIQPSDSQHALLARGWLLSIQRKPEKAYLLIVEFLRQAFLKQDRLPADLRPHLNANLILAARLAYSLHRFADGARWLRMVDKKSNLSPTALEELTWALLEAEAPGEAIGTAIQLQKGLMLRAFTPEAPMVQAMALNEACHFPAAFKTIQQFRHRWEVPYRWLSEAIEKPRALVPLLRALLREKKLDPVILPQRVGWELIRSPRFVSNESLRMELEQVPGHFQSLREQARDHQLSLATQILEANAKLSLDITEFRKKSGPDAELRPALLARLQALRQHWKDYRALRKISGPLKRMTEHSKSWGRTLASGLTQILEADLQQKLKRIHARLDDVMENLSLMEIEILDGASRDLVWQNAHPDFAVEIRKELSKYDRGDTWSWGSARAQIDAEEAEKEEIWEDELGSGGVTLADRCEQKDRYLSLKRRKLQAQTSDP
ncbi:MAG: hypothetical protein ACK5QT_08680 [Oligoflexia bacterium]